MARYTGPTTKKPGLSENQSTVTISLTKKEKFPPGQHGLAKKRKQMSDYAVQLMEKQRQNILTACWKDNSVTFSIKLPANTV